MGTVAQKAFYHTKRWKKLREDCLRRDGYKCQECRKYFRTRPATIVHHKLPLEQFPEYQWELWNLEAVCAKCHNRLHPEKAAAARHLRR